MQLLIHTIDLICQPKSKTDVMLFAKKPLYYWNKGWLLSTKYRIFLYNALSSSVVLTCWKMLMVSAGVGPVKKDQF